MTLEKQREAFDKELHALVCRFLDEFDIPVEEIYEIMVREEWFLIAMAVTCAQEDDEPTGDWGLDGEDEDEWP